MSASSLKDSNIDWIGEIPSHWELISFNRMCRPTRGQSPRPIDDPKYWDDDGEYGWVRISDVTRSGKYLKQTRDYLTSLGKSKSLALDPGELIISIAGTVGVPSITDMKCCIHDGFVHFTGLELDLDYVYNLLTIPQIFSKFGKKGTQTNINSEIIGITKIPVPPINEQKEISRFLEKKTTEIDFTIQSLETQLTLLEEKRSALITQAVTKGLNPNVPMKNSGIEWIGEIPTHWEIIPLKRYFSVQLGKMLQNEQKLASDTQEYYLKSANVQWNGVSLEPRVKMWFSEVEKSKYLLKKDDLLISEGGDVGRSCLYNDEYKECYIQNAINRVRATSSVSTAYLYFFMKAMHESGFIAIICNKSTIPHFTAEKVAEVQFTRTPEDEIYPIVEHLTKECNAIDETSSLLLKEIEKLKEYRTALISAAITGKIDVSNYQME